MQTLGSRVIAETEGCSGSVRVSGSSWSDHSEELGLEPQGLGFSHVYSHDPVD